MTKDHDIEIDSLLRRLAKSEANAEPAGVGHIDADEIAVFAENALPEKAKARVISHLSDCARCRTVLSNVVISARGAEPVEQEKVAGATISFEVPWYKKLFSVRGLATALGVLVILMAGFFAVSLFRNLGGQESVAMDTANANTSVPREPAEDSPADLLEDESAQEGRPPASANVATGEKENDVYPGASSRDDAGPARSGRIAELKAGEEKAKQPAAADDEDAARPQVSAGNRVALANEPNAPAPPPPAPAVRPAQQVADSAEAAKSGDVAERNAPKKDDKANLGALSLKREAEARRQVGGKTFVRKDSVWYDSAYSGQETTNVKRSTRQYRALDSGLRQITDELSGTVVVVWKSKAYRIDP